MSTGRRFYPLLSSLARCQNVYTRDLPAVAERAAKMLLKPPTDCAFSAEMADSIRFGIVR